MAITLNTVLACLFLCVLSSCPVRDVRGHAFPLRFSSVSLCLSDEHALRPKVHLSGVATDEAGEDFALQGQAADSPA